MELNDQTVKELYGRALGRVKLPESLDSIEDLVYWFVDSGAPLLVDHATDVTDAEGFCVSTLFKCDRFHIELYLMRNQMALPDHVHPGVKVLTLELGGGLRGSRKADGLGCSDKHLTSPIYSYPGEAHGATDFPESGRGWLALSFQEWPEGVEHKPVTVWWVGPTMGPKHEALIEEHFPGAVQYPGFADITKTDRFKAQYPVGV